MFRTVIHRGHSCFEPVPAPLGSSVHPNESSSRSSVHPFIQMNSSSRSSVHPFIQMNSSSFLPFIRSSVLVHPFIRSSTQAFIRSSVHPLKVHPFIRFGSSVHPFIQMNSSSRSSVHPFIQMSSSSRSSVHPFIQTGNSRFIRSSKYLINYTVPGPGMTSPFRNSSSYSKHFMENTYHNLHSS